MSNTRGRLAALIPGLILVIGLAPTRASGAAGVIQSIDIRPVLARHPGAGNSLGLAFDPDAGVIYISHGSDDVNGGFVYTLDLDGNVLSEIDFWVAYQPHALPLSLSYDRDTGHLFVFAPVPVGGNVFVGHLVEMSTDGSTIFSDLSPIDFDGGASIVVRADGLWQSRFSENVVRHYSRAGTVIGDIPLAGIYSEEGGPYGLATSFREGFYILNSGRVVEVDGDGNELAEASTVPLLNHSGYPSQPLAIDTDLDGQRVFVQIENDEIFILSPDFFRAIVNPFVTLSRVVTKFDPSPVPDGPAGTYTISATFKNTSDQSIQGPVFLVRQLAGLTNHLLLNADNGPGVRGHELTAGVETLAPGNSVTTRFVIGLSDHESFHFFVDLLAAAPQ